MPTFVPDRVPTFDPASQCWHWWSTPGQLSSFKQDQERAEIIEVVWDLIDPKVGTWSGVIQPLAGFAPFLWNIRHGHLWLRRPEGVWKAVLPKILRKGALMVQEICPDVPRFGRRKPIQCQPTASIDAWHTSGSNTPWVLEEWDEHHLGCHAKMDHHPVLINTVSQRVLPSTPPYHPLLVEMWCRPGPMRFTEARLNLHGVDQNALIITLPNGVRVAHPYSNGLARIALNQGTLAVVLGDVGWMPQYVQHVIDDKVAVPS